MSGRVADYALKVAFNELVAGVFTLESALDGTDALSDLGLFAGTYDDVTDDVVDKVSVTAGTDSMVGSVQASSLSVGLLRPDDISFWNPNNPASPLNLVEPGFVPMRPVELTATVEVEGVPADSPLTVSGNEVTDTTRAAALAWGTGQQGGQTDGLQADSSFFIGRAATNLFRRGQCDATTGGWDATAGGWVGRIGAVPAIDATTAAKFSPQSIKCVCPGVNFQEGVDAVSGTGQAIAAGTVCAASMYVKGPAGAQIASGAYVTNTDATQAYGVTNTFTLSGGWDLIVPATVTVAAGKTGDVVGMRVRSPGPAAQAITFWAAHAMLEKGQSVVAPYVATSGGVTATKPAARVQADAGLLDASEGGVVVWARMGWAATANNHGGSANGDIAIGIGDTINDGIELFFREGDQTWRTRRWHANVSAGDAISVAQTHAAGDTKTLCATWDMVGANQRVSVGVNGASRVSVICAVGALPTLPATFDIGSRAGTFQIDSDVLCVLTFTGTITDAEWAAVYAAGPDADLADYQALLASATVTAVMPMDDDTYQVRADNVEHGIFRGFLRRADWNSDTGICDLYAEDLLLWASRVYPVIASTGPTTTGAAVGLILDQMGVDPGLRSLSVGDSIDDFTADGTQTALALIASLLEAERGTVFVNGDGAVVYESRDIAQARPSSATLTDQLTGQTSGLDLDSLFTRASVTKTGGATSVYIDPDAERRYGRGDGPTIDSPYIPSDTAAGLLAQDLVFDGVNGLPPVIVDLDNDEPSTMPVLLSPLQTVFAIDETLGGTDGEYILQRVVHTIESQHHSAEFTLTRRANRAFALDSGLDGPDVFRY